MKYLVFTALQSASPTQLQLLINYFIVLPIRRYHIFKNSCSYFDLYTYIYMLIAAIINSFVLQYIGSMICMRGYFLPLGKTRGIVSRVCIEKCAKLKTKKRPHEAVRSHVAVSIRGILFSNSFVFIELLGCNNCVNMHLILLN